VEPGDAWASVARQRVTRHGHPYDLRRARGESLPFEDESMDVVISMFVLEHVEDAERVIAEVWRVLKPGGIFKLACENYLSFKEPHYQVVWLPLLPKRIGGLYLQARRRKPKFLMESVTYVAFPQIMRWARRAGFERTRREQPWMTPPRTFKVGVSETFRKPFQTR
jgi:ubiquinone/menaquinone biosynthesis C-methylase UbiE